MGSHFNKFKKRFNDKNDRRKYFEKKNQHSSQNNRERMFEMSMPKSVFNQLHEKGLSIVRVGGDGNCLFRSCADQLYGDEERFDIVRKNAIIYMYNHKDDFEPFMDTDKIPFYRYLNHMSKSGIWGGNLELQAISKAYEYNIVVYQDYHVNLEMQNFPGSNKVLHIIYLGSCHYNSVRTRDGKLPCIALNSHSTKDNIVFTKDQNNNNNKDQSTSYNVNNPMPVFAKISKEIEDKLPEETKEWKKKRDEEDDDDDDDDFQLDDNILGEDSSDDEDEDDNVDDEEENIPEPKFTISERNAFFQTMLRIRHKYPKLRYGRMRYHLCMVYNMKENPMQCYGFANRIYYYGKFFPKVYTPKKEDE